MIFEAQNNHWEAVIALSMKYPTKNRLAIYYTNLALAKTGQIPYRMFHYKQTGVTGLFLDHDLTSSSMWYFSEVYYQLGMTLEAEHCTFEAMMGSPQEPTAQTLQRLIYTNISRRDSATADKYIRFFEHSLAYRSWAKQQRKNLKLAMADPSFTIPGTPEPSRCSEFFINYQYPDHILLKLLQGNPKNRMAFEYLMACNMLEMDFEQVKWCMDTYFKNFDYPAIPVHYEEALMVYQHLKQSNDDSNSPYPISRATRDRYNRYIQAYLASQGSKRNFEQLQKQFGDTYWFYLHFVNPVKLQKKDDNNMY
jgi:tetratricopeptide (TPR) repeat protein